MKIDKTIWIKSFINALVLTISITVLKLISPLNPFSYYVLIGLCVVISLNRPKNFQEAIITGLLIGIFTGIFLSVINLGPMFFAMIIFIVISIIATLMSYFIFEKILK